MPTLDDLPSAAQLHEENKSQSLYALAKKYGSHHQQIRRRIENGGFVVIERGGTRRTHQGRLPGDIRDEYESGATAKEIAAKYSVTEIAVRKKLSSLGTKKRGKVGQTPFKPQIANADSLATEYNDGQTIQQLADKYGVNVNAIRYRLLKSKLYRPRR